MTENDEKGLFMRIDTRYNRFCINKSVTKFIRFCEHIYLFVKL